MVYSNDCTGLAKKADLLSFTIFTVVIIYNNFRRSSDLAFVRLTGAAASIGVNMQTKVSLD